jgi:PKD repeat protein
MKVKRVVWRGMKFIGLFGNLLIVTTLLLAFLAITPSHASAAWPDYCSMQCTPAELFNGEDYTCQYTFTINPAPNVAFVEITSATAQYLWESSAVTIFSGHINVSTFPFTYVFSHSVHVSQSLAMGAHNGVVSVTAKAMGDWFSTTLTYRHYFNSTNIALSASMSGSTYSGRAPLEVNFISLAQGGTTPYSYYWNFGDGQSSTGTNPSHTYTSGGAFTASLTVTDSRQRSVANSVQINAQAPIPPFGTATITASTTSGQWPLTVNFQSQVSGGAPEYSYYWTFSDGGTSTSGNPTHTFNAIGTYTVHLTVTDSTSQNAQSNDLAITVVNPATASGLPDWVYYLSIGVIIVAAIIVIGVIYSSRRNR